MIPRQFILDELARAVGGRVEGDAQTTVAGLAPVDQAGPDELTFAGDARHAAKLAVSRARAAIVPADLAVSAAELGKPLLRVADVAEAVAVVLGLIGEDEHLPPAGVHPSAQVDPSASVDATAAVGPNVVVGARARVAAGCALCAGAAVGPDVELGEGTVLFEGTAVHRRSRIGRSCRIGPNAVIGSSGFGYYRKDGRHVRVPHAGHVEIADFVDIGACTCVDRGKFGATRIGQGSKIDNLVQIAHNVQIGRGCLIAGCTAIAGSAVVEDDVVLGGRAGVADNITIAQGTVVAANSVAIGNTRPQSVLMGFPAIDVRNFRRSAVLFGRLPELNDRLKQLEKKVQAIEAATNH